MLEFVFQLDTHDRAAVPEHQPPHLTSHLPIPLADIIEVDRIVGPEPHTLFLEELRQPAVVDLAVAERPDADEHIQPVLRAKLDKMPQIPLAAERENTLVLLVFAPEKVGGDGVQATRFHFQDGLFPLLARVARGMHFPGHHDPRFTVAREIFRVGRQDIARRAHASPFLLRSQVQSTLLAKVDLVHDLSDSKRRATPDFPTRRLLLRPRDVISQVVWGSASRRERISCW